MALIAPMLFTVRPVMAQDQQVLRVIIADVTNLTPPKSANLGVNATAALYTELANAGLGKFNVASTSEVRNEAISLGIKVPSNPAAPANFTKPDLVRIAKSLNADAVVYGQVGATKPQRGKPAGVGLTVTIEDVAANIPINGGGAVVSAAIRPGEPLDTEEQYNRAIADAAQDVVRQVVQRQVPTGTVLNINQEQVILNRGLRDGYKVGDTVVILREGPNGAKIKEGEVRIARAYATDSEADIISNIGGIQPEDLTRVYFKNTFVLNPIFDPTTGSAINPTPTAHGPAFSAAAIGGTLGVIALGVLVSQASKGGQQSVTNLTAEPTSLDITPEVRLRWGDNIFGQGNVLQYKIYRDPGFPFGVTPPTGGSNGGGGTGGGTTTNNVIPVDAISGIFHEYTDLPTPHTPYATGKTVLIGDSNGGLGSSAGSGGGSNNGNGGNGGGNAGGSFTPPPGTDTGFTPGVSYHYFVSAIILRTIPSTGNSNGTGNGTGGGTGGGIGGGGTGGGGTGNGNGGTGNGSGGTEQIETDPAQSGLTTPISPVILVSPSNSSGNIDARKFAPTWNSSVGADIFQLEVSTDRSFSNPARILRVQVLSTAPLTNGVAQSVASPIDLTTSPELLSDPNWAAFVNGTTTTSPQLFWRVGGRHDADNPGPVNWISKRADDPDRTFRFVYDTPIFFQAAPLPPPPPGKATAAANALNKQYAASHRAGLPAPKPGDTGITRSQNRPRVLSPQEILTGGSRRRN